MPFDPAVRRDRRPSSRGRAPKRSAGGRGGGSGARVDDDFFLYVEGPRDGDILRVWARRLSPALTRPLEQSLVILGGRRPARAVDHFRDAGGAATGCRGLVVLDRDHHGEAGREASGRLVGDEPGLEMFTWGRRHIESYVLVRDAIGRVLRRREDDAYVTRLVASHVPDPDDEEACRDIDAKRLLGSKGALARDLGRALSPSEIARAMRRDELHGDVVELFERIRTGLGLGGTGYEVVKRSPPGSR